MSIDKKGDKPLTPVDAAFHITKRKLRQDARAHLRVMDDALSRGDDDSYRASIAEAAGFGEDLQYLQDVAQETLAKLSSKDRIRNALEGASISFFDEQFEAVVEETPALEQPPMTAIAAPQETTEPAIAPKESKARKPRMRRAKPLEQQVVAPQIGAGTYIEAVAWFNSLPLPVAEVRGGRDLSDRGERLLLMAGRMTADGQNWAFVKKSHIARASLQTVGTEVNSSSQKLEEKTLHRAISKFGEAAEDPDSIRDFQPNLRRVYSYFKEGHPLLREADPKEWKAILGRELDVESINRLIQVAAVKYSPNDVSKADLTVRALEDALKTGAASPQAAEAEKTEPEAPVSEEGIAASLFFTHQESGVSRSIEELSLSEIERRTLEFFARSEGDYVLSRAASAFVTGNPDPVESKFRNVVAGLRRKLNDAFGEGNFVERVGIAGLSGYKIAGLAVEDIPAIQSGDTEVEETEAYTAIADEQTMGPDITEVTEVEQEDSVASPASTSVEGRTTGPLDTYLERINRFNSIPLPAYEERRGTNRDIGVRQERLLLVAGRTEGDGMSWLNQEVNDIVDVAYDDVLSDPKSSTPPSGIRGNGRMTLPKAVDRLSTAAEMSEESLAKLPHMERVYTQFSNNPLFAQIPKERWREALMRDMSPQDVRKYAEEAIREIADASKIGPSAPEGNDQEGVDQIVGETSLDKVSGPDALTILQEDPVLETVVSPAESDVSGEARQAEMGLRQADDAELKEQNLVMNRVQTRVLAMSLLGIFDDEELSQKLGAEPHESDLKELRKIIENTQHLDEATKMVDPKEIGEFIKVFALQPEVVMNSNVDNEEAQGVLISLYTVNSISEVADMFLPAVE
jgi:hypothetical protein